MPDAIDPAANAARVRLGRIARAWLRLGCIGFGGPPAHLALLRELVVEREAWIDADEFEDIVAVASLLPGPASTQTAVLCAWRVGGIPGGLVGAAGFILPGLLAVVALATVLLAASPPLGAVALGAGAGAAVPAVALAAGWSLVGPSRQRATAAGALLRWAIYLAAGVIATILAGPYLVLCLLACGLAELAVQRVQRRDGERGGQGPSPRKPGSADGAPPRGRGALEASAALLLPLAVAAATPATLLALAWMGFKVGVLAYGGGFVIVPLMQADAVDVHGWLTDGQFLSAVAIGQVVPGPVVNTGTAIGWAAAGVPGALTVAAAIFLPTIAIAIAAGQALHRIRASALAQGFLAGAAPAAIGAILGSAVPLALALGEPWQWAITAAAAALLLWRRLGVVIVLLSAAASGALLALAGAPMPS